MGTSSTKANVNLHQFAPIITLAGCMATINDLARKGRRAKSVKLALWAAAISPLQKLARNGKAVRILAGYVNGGRLPHDYEGLAELLKPAGIRFFSKDARALWAIEEMAQAGRLPECPRDDWTFDHWHAWRDEVAAIYGMSLKTASFAGLLLCPLACPLVPVDMWVMRRFDQDTDASPGSKPKYLNIERMVRDERDRNGQASMPLGAWHWFKWSEIRQAAGAEPLSEKPESHDLLSPRWY